ncbi:MAG: tripartite tricarboxylate transporter substrate binding protein [Proteobacteria bacterium]|nr:tripartite tricarboxylate transporter substrate binding protein [Pseudomonadota bacterium]
MRRRLAALATLSLALVTGASPGAGTTAGAQGFPERPVRIVVPFAAGGANDIVARLIQPRLEKALGQPVIVENRPAASGTVGTDAVAKAAPDGHTLLMAFTTHTVNPAVSAKLPYDTERDFAPIVMIGRSPLLFIVNADVAAKTFAEFLALAKANRGKFNYATPGAASQAHLLVAWLSSLAGVTMQHIPYKGGAPAVLATVAGETQVTVMSPIASLAQINAGRLRALAVTSGTRDRHFPELPAIAEHGFAGFEGVAWIGLFAPAATPRPIVARINMEVNRVIRDPMIAAQLDGQGMTPAGGSPDEFAVFVACEIARWRAAARSAGLAPN